MTFQKLVISAALAVAAFSAAAQDITTLYTMTDVQMTERFELDEFRVARMHELIADLPDEII